MRDGLADLLEKADLALSSCEGIVPPQDLEPLVVTVADVRSRLSYPEDVLVAALAGGTGSGKSSLLNAVAGSGVAFVGGARPTTEVPLALVPEGRAAAMEGYLDRLGVTERVRFDVDWLCLIDLPDSDSVVVGHGLTVEALLPRLDVVVWVVDPEKYRDAGLHERFLRPLAAYSGRFLFVLNQVDRLAPESVAAVAADLEDALAEDGFRSATVVLTAADPPSGPPIGIDGLLTALGGVARSRPGIHDKLLLDLEGLSDRLSAVLGAGALGFEQRASAVLDSVSEAMGEGQWRRARDELTGLLEELAAEAGGPVGSTLRRMAAEVPGRVEEVVADLGPPPFAGRSRGLRRFFRRSQGAASSVEEQAREALHEKVLRPARDLLARRAAANAALADLALSVRGHQATDG